MFIQDPSLLACLEYENLVPLNHLPTEMLSQQPNEQQSEKARKLYCETGSNDKEAWRKH